MDYLDFLYSGKGNVSRMYDVWNVFHCPQKGVKSLTTYFMDFKKVYEELNALMPFSPDVRVQQAQREQMEVFSRVLRTENVRLLSTPMFLLQKEEMQRMQGGLLRQDVTMIAKEFAKYSQYQEALKASTPVSALAESGKTCLVSSSNKWIIDSGVTDHMTSNHKTFSTFRTHSAPPVTVADGSTYEIKGSRTVKPTSSITLSSVLNLPNLAFNLISDLMMKRTFGKGHVSDGLYILDEWVPRPVACVSTASPVEAHCRLGHPSLPC
ncbi:hypothetical protein CK203_039640 [Vitis vinifera]|uniref:Retrovirus-related Pol polyprotein from transposon TNT 1-94-like beta-barrel domain-containing protein n=1 Tax=Vitis vinifera TaxID=29760 RepID=A0A438HFP5_VITVI|nr:hypothetical protein CK203_039640 [Vitis vinifera]